MLDALNTPQLTCIMGQIGPWQVILIVAVVLLLFGGKKIPELMKGLGRGVKEFKDAQRGEEDKNDRDRLKD
jgi:sec-independent protein translocase protein TatA